MVSVSVNLPEKKSEILEIALKDLIAVEQMDKYTIDMGTWCEVDLNYGTCTVCLAGAVMMNTLKATPVLQNDWTDQVGLIPSNFEPSIMDKLRWIDNVRTGDDDYADAFEDYVLAQLGNNYSYLDISFEYPRYHANHEAFKQYMQHRIDHFKSIGQ